MSKETKKSQSQFMDTFKRLCRNKTAVIGMIYYQDVNYCTGCGSKGI